MKIRPHHLAFAFLAVAILTVRGLGLLRWLGSAGAPMPAHGNRHSEAPGDFGEVPAFTLVERAGRRVSRADLEGRIWVANFIYTRCTDTCPLQSARMAKLQADFAPEPDVRFLSISVDPEHDTPQVLRGYAARFGADPERWLFLTGERRVIDALVRDGFHLAVENRVPLVTMPPTGPARPALPPPGTALPARSSLLTATPALAYSPGDGADVLHSSWFVLLDRRVRLRGYYPSEHPDGLVTLAADIRSLLAQPR